ncbi:MAG: dehydrogenase [Rickettsiales bacterium]|nr:dehydrogenase [Rickettsiales bacterium]
MRIRAILIVLFSSVLLSGCVTAKPSFRGLDRERPQIAVSLAPIMAGERQLSAPNPTDIGFLPGNADDPVLVIAQRRGQLVWHRLSDGASGTLLQVKRIGSAYMEKGLVGFTFHPDYPNTSKLYTYHLRATRDGGQSVISEYRIEGTSLETMKAVDQRILFELEQPQEGHNGGQVAFGPDGYLYTAFGDGGFQNDPDNRSQDTTNYHGSIIRIDPDQPSAGRPYGLPADNPFLDGGHLPEVWAFGFRNPWRFTFSPSGQMVVADVGQDALEEIDLVVRGGNYGWCIRESSIAHQRCSEQAQGRDGTDFEAPIYEYTRRDGRAVIGGYFYGGSAIPALKGKYIFGDHISGALWALDLPTNNGQPAAITALGSFGGTWTTFGRDLDGELYVATNEGQLRKLVPR